MRYLTRLPDGDGEVTLYLPSDVTTETRGVKLHREAAAAFIERFVRDDVWFRGALVDVLRALGYALDDASWVEADELVRRVADALRVRRVVAYRVTRARPTAAFGSDPADEPEEPDSPHDTSWIEIHLVDQDGRDMADVPYRITMPDGGVRAGTLDRHGRAREEGIVPGTCQISFHTLHGPDWSRA